MVHGRYLGGFELVISLMACLHSAAGVVLLATLQGEGSAGTAAPVKS